MIFVIGLVIGFVGGVIVQKYYTKKVVGAAIDDISALLKKQKQ